MDDDYESPYTITKKDVDWAVEQFYGENMLIQKEGIENKFPHIETHRQWVKEFGEHKY